jgi:hypothetical protein
MRIVCMTNEGQLPMMKSMLNSALKAGFPMNQFHCYILTSNPDTATYGTSNFHAITTKKLEVILDNLLKDSEILWIDNDIVLFENTINDLRSKQGTFVMQDDIWSPCTGFFLARNSLFSLKVLRESIRWLANNQNPQVNDQHAFTYVYKRTIGATVSLLPREEYPNGEIYFNQKKTEKAKMVHCNYLSKTSEKVERLKEHNLWDDSDTAFEKVNKYYI